MNNDPADIDWDKARKEIAEENKDLKKRVDPMGRLVAEKTANRPFFVHQDYKKKQEAEKAAQAERKRVRFEKIAKGEDVGRDPDQESHLFGNIIKLLLLTMLMGLYAGYFITGDPYWGYEHKWLTVRHWASLIPDGTQKAYTEHQLLQYDGSNPERPILLAVCLLLLISISAHWISHHVSIDRRHRVRRD